MELHLFVKDFRLSLTAGRERQEVQEDYEPQAPLGFQAKQTEENLSRIWFPA